MIKILAFSFLSSLILTSAYADDPASVGLRGIKSMVNQIQFSSADLERTGSSREVIHTEQEAVKRNTLHVDQVTGVDRFIEKVEVSNKALYLRFAF